jgi:ADP-ribose pyrophosphatase YjhB (NUDIX family)
MPDYETSYLGQLRKVAGEMKLISVGVRAIIQNDERQILFVRRNDTREWVMPAGSMEVEESVLDCLKREVWEETGLTILNPELIAIYSEPRFSYVTTYGDSYQMVRFVFLVKQWSGELLTHTDETINAQFFALDNLPEIPILYQETIHDLQTFDGKVIVK